MNIFLVTFVSAFLVFLFVLFTTRKRKVVLSNVSEFLCLLDENKIFPISGNDKWHLECVSQGLRTWSRTLASNFQQATLKVCASCAVVGSPLEVVENVLKDGKMQKQWNSLLPFNLTFRVLSFRADTRGHSDADSFQKYSLEGSKFNKEVVGLDFPRADSSKEGYAALLCHWTMSKVETIFRVKNFERSWCKQNDREFWLIENSINFKHWIFYLVNALDGTTNSCLVTILTNEKASLLFNFPTAVQSFGSLHSQKKLPALLLAGLSDYLGQDKFKLTQMLQLPGNEINLTSGSSPGLNIIELEDPSPSLTKRKNLFGKTQEQQEISLFQRFKNMLEEKKDDVEQTASKSKRWSILPGENQVSDSKKETESPINPIDIIKRFSIASKFFEEKKNESETNDSGNASEAKECKDAKKRWGLLSEAAEKISEDKSSGKTFLHRTSFAPLNETPDIDSDLLQCLETMIDNAALDIIAEKCKVANLDIHAKTEDQASQAGGWIYCGLEKDTVILKKVSNSSLPLHSYIGKGMVSHSPKLVYEILRSPNSRVAYDDMVKNVEVLKELKGGIKIVRLLYEVGQHFKRELREFIILQGERIEGMKHVITMQSVDWNVINSLNLSQALSTESTTLSFLSTNSNSGSRRNSLDLTKLTGSPIVGVKDGRKVTKLPKQQQLIEGLVSAKMFSSGWIIEPVMKANKLCSMITYISQMKLDTGMRTALSYLAEDIALKQPLCIVHLRHYLATLDVEDELLTSASDVDCKRGKSVTLSISNALARFRNNASADKMEESDGDIVV